MTMYFIKGFLLVVLIFMVFSPRIFFRCLDRYLFAEDPKDMSVPYADTTRLVQLDSSGLNVEEKKISNIKKMIVSAPTPDMRRLWEIKLAECLRNTRWKRLEEFSGGTQRV
jgi:hypothetical protein